MTAGPGTRDAHESPARRAAAPSARVPWQFRLGKALDRRGVRGGWRLVEMARTRGLLDRVVRYDVGRGVTVAVPLFRPENCFDRHDVLRYEVRYIGTLLAAVRDWPGPVTLVDCGADIGLFSSLLALRCPRIDRIVAFEPNPAAHAWLADNLGRLAIAADARRSAVSDFSGRGELRRPDYDRDSEYARYLVPTGDGSIPVERIDDVVSCTGRSLLMKIDVEGGEIDVVRGARRVLSEAARFVVGFEAHRDVYRRTGIDPLRVVEVIRSVRPCRATVSEAFERAVEPGVPFFEQFRERTVYNVVCSAA